MTDQGTPFAQKILRVSATLTTAAIPFVFGGAIARNYYAEPRLTMDMDIGILLPPDAHAQVFTALATLFAVVDTAAVALAILRDGQVRVFWDETPLDLFFSYDPFHVASARRTRRVPFGGAEIPIQSVEDVILHKLLFNRPKDWRDIADMLYAQRDMLDRVYIQEWLQYFFPPDAIQETETRIRLFTELLATADANDGNERE